MWRPRCCLSSRKSLFAGWGGWDGSDSEVETRAVCGVYSEVKRQHDESGLLTQHLSGGLKDGRER